MRVFDLRASSALMLACLSAAGCAGDRGDENSESEERAASEEESAADRDQGDDESSPARPDAGRGRDASAMDGGGRPLDGGGGAGDAKRPADDPDRAPDAEDAGATPAADAGMDAGAPGPDGGGAVTGPFPPPIPDECITDVGPGDHTFTCQGLTYLVMVDARCASGPCGLIFDVHGAAMSGEVMRANTQLHELAPEAGYLVVHPSANGGVWNLDTDPPLLADFMQRMIAAFHVDTKRVHVTGFSMGSAITFWFLCNHPELLASTGPVTGQSAEQVSVVGSGEPCIESLDADWMPRVPILFMSGRQDSALSIEAARARSDGIVSRLGLTGGDEVDGDDTFARTRWTGEGGMVFDFLEHDYTNLLIAGHCIPGGPALDYIACSDGGDSLHWGRTVLQWFIEHPKP